jgi:hypothetical protein
MYDSDDESQQDNRGQRHQIDLGEKKHRSSRSLSGRSRKGTSSRHKTMYFPQVQQYQPMVRSQGTFVQQPSQAGAPLQGPVYAPSGYCCHNCGCPQLKQTRVNFPLTMQEMMVDNASLEDWRELITPNSQDKGAKKSKVRQIFTQILDLNVKEPDEDGLDLPYRVYTCTRVRTCIYIQLTYTPILSMYIHSVLYSVKSMAGDQVLPRVASHRNAGCVQHVPRWQFRKVLRG